MINTKALRAQFKSERQAMKRSQNIGQWILLGLIMLIGTVFLAVIIRLACGVIVDISRLIK